MAEDEAPAKARRLMYDDYTGVFYHETLMESLERASRYNEKKAETFNRGEMKKLEFQNKQVASAYHIFDMKHCRELNSARESLRATRAHKAALDSIAIKNRQSQRRNSNFGTYGLGTTKAELHTEIEIQKKKLTPTYLRVKEANRLLRQRRAVQEFDRTLNTPELYKSWQRRRPSTTDSSLMSEQSETSAEYLDDRVNDSAKTSARIILPPLQVCAADTRRRQQTLNTAVPVKSPDRSSSISRASGSSVFITTSTSMLQH